jgi:hypothetical protein
MSAQAQSSKCRPASDVNHSSVCRKSLSIFFRLFPVRTSNSSGASDTPAFVNAAACITYFLMSTRGPLG